MLLRQHLNLPLDPVRESMTLSTVWQEALAYIPHQSAELPKKKPAFLSVSGLFS
jgi:hypothetical protein